ncbi:hypothetical protein CDAR_46011 [Caerostris darwini]|uniref:Secreted protein n=1 Tax=Caerostris darwini TaxID=1538125 RepID=A0AAV4MAX4_9ARAC|nr:hypothetical protein CDAR_46011 [Caerostris darwini]
MMALENPFIFLFCHQLLYMFRNGWLILIFPAGRRSQASQSKCICHGVFLRDAKSTPPCSPIKLVCTRKLSHIFFLEENLAQSGRFIINHTISEKKESKGEHILSIYSTNGVIVSEKM